MQPFEWKKSYCVILVNKIQKQQNKFMVRLVVTWERKEWVIPGHEEPSDVLAVFSFLICGSMNLWIPTEFYTHDLYTPFNVCYTFTKSYVLCMCMCVCVCVYLYVYKCICILPLTPLLSPAFTQFISCTFSKTKKKKKFFFLMFMISKFLTQHSPAVSLVRVTSDIILQNAMVSLKPHCTWPVGRIWHLWFSS